MTAEGDVVTPPRGGCGHPSVLQMHMEDGMRMHLLNCPSRELLSAGTTATVSVMRPLELSKGANTDR